MFVLTLYDFLTTNKKWCSVNAKMAKHITTRNGSVVRVHWTSISEFVCTSKVKAKQNIKRKKKQDVRVDKRKRILWLQWQWPKMTAALRALLTEILPIWRYLWCFHLENHQKCRLNCRSFFCVRSASGPKCCTRILTAASAFNRHHLYKYIDNFQCLTFFSIWYFVCLERIVLLICAACASAVVRARTFILNFLIPKKYCCALRNRNETLAHSIVRSSFGINLTFFSFHLRNYIT